MTPARPIQRASFEWLSLREWAMRPGIVGLKFPADVRRWFRSNPCVKCQTVTAPRDLHHFFGSVGPMKSPDVFVVPVCRPCHTAHENNPAFRDECLLAWVRLAAVALAKPPTA